MCCDANIDISIESNIKCTKETRHSNDTTNRHTYIQYCEQGHKNISGKLVQRIS